MIEGMIEYLLPGGGGILTELANYAVVKAGKPTFGVFASAAVAVALVVGAIWMDDDRIENAAKGSIGKFLGDVVGGFLPEVIPEGE